MKEYRSIKLAHSEFQGHHANQAYYKSGIISPEYFRISLLHKATFCYASGERLSFLPELPTNPGGKVMK